MTDSLSSRADDHSFPKDPKDYEKKPKEIKDRKVAKRRSTLERLEEEKQRNQGDVGASFQTDTFGSYDDHDPFKELNEKEKWKAGIPYDCLGLFRTDNNPQTWAKIALNDTPLSKEERENLLQMKKKRDNYVSQSDKDEFVQKFSDNVKAPTYLFIRDQYRATRDDKKKKELGMVMESLWNSMNEEEKDKVRNKDKK